MCKECERIEESNRQSNGAIVAKQRRYSESPLHRAAQQRAQAEQRRITVDSSVGHSVSDTYTSRSSPISSTNLDRAAISSTSSMLPPSSDSLDEVVTATVASSDIDNGNKPNAQDITYYVEIDDDQIHITTASSTTPTTATTASTREPSESELAFGGSRMYYASSHTTQETSNVHKNNETAPIELLAKKNIATDDIKTDNVNNNDHIDYNSNNKDIAIDAYISDMLIESLNNTLNTVQLHAQNGPRKVALIKSETHSIDENGNNQPSDIRSMGNEPLHLKYAANKSDSPDSLSDCSAKYSNNTDAYELPQNPVIAMNAGSNYSGSLNNGNALVIRQLSQIPRTESLEVQPSSASGPDDDVGDEIVRIESDDESVSLVDSLDEPKSGVVAKISDRSPRQGDKSAEAFFVPMQSEAIVDEKLNDAGQSPRIETSIASSMPSKLRDRLEKRHLDMHVKRKEEEDRKQSAVIAEKQHRRRKIGRVEQAFVGLEAAESPTITNVSSANCVAPMALKSKSRFLRSEIGLLESYTIDAQGNLQFRPQPTVTSTMTTTTTSVRSTRKPQSTNDSHTKRSIVHHTVMKKISANKSSKVQRKDTVATVKRKPLKTFATPNQINEVRNASRRNKTDSQQMTLYHQAHSDIITPDADCGPRRMYQKTEIHDGEKRIEILEIVECLNSSPDSSSMDTATPNVTSSQPIKCSSKSSRIPVPIAALSATSTRTKDTIAPLQSNRLIRNLNTNQNTTNNTKVDQLIADLLIEALNHSTEFGIEFVKMPSGGSVASANNSHDKNNKNDNVPMPMRKIKVSRQSAGNGISSGKRSTHSGSKYQRIFDAIPEEKIGNTIVEPTINDVKSSVNKADAAVITTQNTSSTNSQADGSAKTTTSTSSSSTSCSSVSSVVRAPTTATSTITINNGNDHTNDNRSGETDNKTHSTGTVFTPTTSISTKLSQAATEYSSVVVAVPVSRGRAAIEVEDDRKIDAWFDCFGRSRNDTPVEQQQQQQQQLLPIQPPPPIDEGTIRYLHKTRLFA